MDIIGQCIDEEHKINLGKPKRKSFETKDYTDKTRNTVLT